MIHCKENQRDSDYKKKGVIIQGITGAYGSLHARNMMAYGTNVVAGVTPGKGGQKFDDKVPIYNSVQEAVDATGAKISIIYVPAKFFLGCSKRSTRGRNQTACCNSRARPSKRYYGGIEFSKTKGMR